MRKIPYIIIAFIISFIIGYMSAREIVFAVRGNQIENILNNSQINHKEDILLVDMQKYVYYRGNRIASTNNYIEWIDDNHVVISKANSFFKTKENMSRINLDDKKETIIKQDLKPNSCSVYYDRSKIYYRNNKRDYCYSISNNKNMILLDGDYSKARYGINCAIKYNESDKYLDIQNYFGASLKKIKIENLISNNIINRINSIKRIEIVGLNIANDELYIKVKALNYGILVKYDLSNDSSEIYDWFPIYRYAADYQVFNITSNANPKLFDFIKSDFNMNTIM